MMHKCLECGAEATWVRSTQFAGEHPYCDQHAKQESDFKQSDSYTYWYALQETALDALAGDGGYSLGTQENYEAFNAARNYHYTNTSNPVDFPRQDPKPELGPAAIKANVEYYAAIAAKHTTLAQQAMLQAEQWNQKLRNLK